MTIGEIAYLIGIPIAYVVQRLIYDECESWGDWFLRLLASFASILTLGMIIVLHTALALNDWKIWQTTKPPKWL